MIKLIKKIHYSFQLPVKISFLLCLYMLCAFVPSPFKLYNSIGEFLAEIFARIIVFIILVIMLCVPTYLICRFIFRNSYAKFIVKKNTALQQINLQYKSNSESDFTFRNLLHNFISYILSFFYIQPDGDTQNNDVPSDDDYFEIITTKNSDTHKQSNYDANINDVATAYDNNEIIPTINELELPDFGSYFDNVPPDDNDNKIVPTIKPDNPEHLSNDTNTYNISPIHNDSKVTTHKNKPKKPKEKQMTQEELLQFAIACNQRLHKKDMSEWNSRPSSDTEYIPNFTNEFEMVNENNSMTDFDSMTGSEFEEFCACILSQNGFINIEITKGSHDQGTDIIAEKEDIKYAIQCKCYSSNIGNDAVQEAFAGKSFYNCHIAVVLTNSFFTSSAQILATKNGVLLWDRNKLLKLINCSTENKSSI